MKLGRRLAVIWITALATATTQTAQALLPPPTPRRKRPKRKPATILTLEATEAREQ